MTDTGPTEQEGSPEDGGIKVLGGWKEECEQNSDCQSQWCVPFIDSYVCTVPCMEECPDNWKCRAVANTGEDPVFICMPPDDRLCFPCITSADCAGGRCVVIDAADRLNYCTQPCHEGRCRSGFQCQSLELEVGEIDEYCLPTTGTCSCTQSNAGMERICLNTNEHGSCVGRESCVVAEGWVGCTAVAPLNEVCNQQDDDCDGFVDDVAGLGEPCTREVILDDGPHACAGVSICSPGQAELTCNAPLPQPEVCNQQDDDCDGQTDETFPELGQPCEAGTGSCLRGGSLVCDEQGGVACNAVAGPGSLEQCNSLDDDCDGEIDEEFREPGPGGRYVALDHCGACGQSCVGLFPNATARCDDQSERPECAIAACDPGFYNAGNRCQPFDDPACRVCADDRNCGMPGNRCLELDDGRFCARDCREGNLYGTPAGWCPEGFICLDLDELGAGIRQCVPQSGSCSCAAAEDLGAVRSCLAIGELGSCAGLQSCDPAVGWSLCNAEPPAVETCNGLDDDCNGRVDDRLLLPVEPCQVENAAGTCTGAWQCAGAAGWQCRAAEPQPEVCNYQDDNCDGQFDEDFVEPGSGLYLRVDHCGLCGFACQGSVIGATEVACVEQAGVPRCSAVACQDGYLLTAGPVAICYPQAGAADCSPCLEDAHCGGLQDGRCTAFADGSFCTRACPADGQCGDGFACVAGRCQPRSGSCSCQVAQAGQARPCRVEALAGTCLGLETCDPAQGWIGCTAAQPRAEECNGLDDDCDRLVDEQLDPPQAGGCRNENEHGTCTGQWFCAGPAGWSCDAGTPDAERCDYQDNDCDGVIDEGFLNQISGLYDSEDHCGVCGYTCAGRFPHATQTRCEVTDGVARCAVESCEAGYFRASAVACVAVTTDVCAPCQSDRNCTVPGDRCLELDGQKVCGQDCAAGNLHGLPAGVCPGGFTCQALSDEVSQCVPVSGSCACLAEHLGDSRWCSVANELGTCTGFEVCDPDEGWVACTARTPEEELCDGLDNDCNGIIDEGFVLLGHPCTDGEGVCRRAGVMRCTPDGLDVMCGAEPGLPLAERCNYQDDDCDGETDEDFRDPETSLYATYDHCGSCNSSCEGAILFATRTACRAQEASSFCVASDCEPGTQLAANGRVCLPITGAFDCTPCVDDQQCESLTGGRCERFADGRFCTRGCAAPEDCSGGYDCVQARCWPVSRSCNCLLPNAGEIRVCFESNALGTCMGTQLCQPEQTPGWTECTAAIPLVEACNGLDDDCNGLVDEGVVPPDGPACDRTNAWGTCAGVKVCQGLDGWQCAAQVPAEERCNSRDDDCDGLVDEEFPALLAPCFAGQGGCRTVGVARCTPDGNGTVCTAQPGAPEPERCDSQDNDCDGSTDEDFPELNRACSVGQGICEVNGLFRCQDDGRGTVCSARPGLPLIETCNSLDDDCDGETDEDFRIDGRIATLEHCGSCGRTCVGAIPNASARCDGTGDQPRCVVEQCEPGYAPGSDISCLPLSLGQCEPCLLDEDCIFPDALCGAQVDGSFCLNPCQAEADCPDGSHCGLLGEAQVCLPDNGSCLCDAANLGLIKGCEVVYQPGDERRPYSCFGVQTCQADGWGPCHLPVESCNSFDDDCDGQTDEDFLDEQGRLTSDTNCAECGNNCTLLVYPGGAGACNTFVDPPRCSVSCNDGCEDVNANPADGCECCNPQPEDFPDPLGFDANCDGIDGERNNAVFVAKDGDDAAPGTLEQPKLTIQEAIRTAVARQKRDVYVATGVYAETITLARRVAIYGGYASDFRVRNTLLYEVAIFAQPPAGETLGAVNAMGLQGGAPGSTVFDGFSIYGYAVRTPGESSYAVSIRDCDATLRFSYNKVHAGVGGRGGRGTDGEDGANGVLGGPGRNALDLLATYQVTEHNCTAANTSPGGVAGVAQCPGGVSVAGGAGGNRICPTFDGNVTGVPAASEHGVRGTGPGGGGAGGSAGQDVYHQAYQCLGYTTFASVEGGDGADGRRGTDGGAGGACNDPQGRVVAGRWAPAAASNGTAGSVGDGGGGGGSGAGAWVHTSCFSKDFGYDNLGGTGGGGGSGACGGTFGTAGTGGGGAFGIFVVFTAPPQSLPAIHHDTLYGGVGGIGGDGGNGGTGGSGGAGALGGRGGGNFDPVDPTYPSFKGGKGGNGGDGGHGGGGGGGCGGSAYDLYVWNAAGADLAAWKAGNTFASPGVGGPGGMGGFSLGQPGGQGLAGVAAPTNF